MGLPFRRVGNGYSVRCVHAPVVSLHPERVEPPIRYAAPEQSHARPLAILSVKRYYLYIKNYPDLYYGEAELPTH